MTKQQAIEEMKLGKKVTHRYFDKDEFIRMREYGSIPKIDSSIYWLSDKHQVSARMFWNDRNGDHWNDGWEIFN